MTAMTTMTAAPAMSKVSVEMPDAGSTPADGEAVGATVWVGASVGAIVSEGVGVCVGWAAAGSMTTAVVALEGPYELDPSKTAVMT